MNCIIPFESNVKFSGPVKEICSISLEHDITKNDDQILGNFYISGTYKEHELSVNTCDYNFTLPFSVELTNRIDKDSLDFNIDNFTYELNNDEMKINIDYSLNADDIMDEEFDPVDIIRNDEENNELYLQDNNIEQNDETLNTNDENFSEKIINNLEINSDYITYKVHQIQKEESIESIAMKYNIDKDIIIKTNENTEYNEGNKVIIPINND